MTNAITAHQAVTLISFGLQARQRSWETSGSQKLIFVENFATLCEVIQIPHPDREVAIVILDHVTDAEGFLSLLAGLPEGFLADIVFIGDGKRAFLSTAASRGERKTCALDAKELELYLKTHELVTAENSMAVARPQLVDATQFPVQDTKTPAEIVLVVDDEEPIRIAVSIALQCDGRKVIACSDIEAAQIIVETQPVTAIVTDVRLTGAFAFEGLDFVKHALKHRPDARLILMTGNGSEEMREEALARGASALLLKPFSIAEIEELLPPPTSTTVPGSMVEVPPIEKILSQRQTYPVFHPIMRTTTDGEAIFGFESLTRMTTDGPLRNPELLFKYAERRKKLYELELHCMTNALAASADLPENAVLFMNAHPQTLCRPGFAAAFTRAAFSHGVDLHRVVLEVTEQGAIDDIERCMVNLEILRSAGARFALDDVGVAYSHLMHINRIAPSFLKVSQEFGSDFETDAAKTKIVRNIVTLAESFGCELILEGIETEDTAAAARAMGIPMLQGYLFGKPAPATARLTATR